MIRKQTVLILGAGASMDFDYPSGRELKDVIVEHTLSANNDVYRQLLRAGFHASKIKDFNDALRFSGRVSVDAFLEHRPEFINVGKAAVAAELIRKENPDTLFRLGGNWYEHLFQALNTSFASVGENNIGIVTFNYDRSFETYLFMALTNAYGKSEDDVSNVLASIPVYHVHGKLGSLPWGAENGRPYKYTNDPDEIYQAANEIRIMAEASDIEDAFRDAKKLISMSKRLIFIGFGFHSQNVLRLGIDLESGQHENFGSAYGFTELEKAEIVEMFRPSVIKLGDSEWKSTQFLREMISW
jgi:hypothetical protein